MNDEAGRALVLALLLLCLPVAGPAGAGAGVADAGDPVPATAAVDEDGADAENETVRHRNPDEYADSGDLAGLESWLSGRLSSQLEHSSISLSQGQYDLAREVVGDEYRDRLEQYVEVAGETDDEGTDGTDADGTDDEGADTRDPETAFEDAADHQETFANLTEAYRDTKAAYDSARQDGDEDRARELARELEALAAEIDAVGGDLVVTYEVISFGTDEDLSAATDAVEQTRADVEREQAVVRDEQFVETALDLEPERESASFLEPLVASGEIRAADDTPVDADAGQLLVDGDPVAVEAGANGTVEFAYRPTTQSLDAETVTVEYVPAPDSAYLGSETALNVSLEQVDPAVSGLEATDDVAYGDALSVGGTLAVADVPVDDVSLEVRLDGVALGELPVTDGTFDGSVSVPAAVRDGDRTLSVGLPFEDRVLAGTTAETAVTVEETATELTVDATAAGEAELRVDGRLETVAGDGLADQPVEVLVDGDAVSTPRTDSAGAFAEALAVPSAANGDATVTVRYDGAGTNLGAATSETTVSLPGARGDGGSTSIPSWAVRAGLAAVAVAIGAGWWWRRRADGSPADPDPPTGPDPDPAAESSAADRSDAHEVIDALLTQADDFLTAGRADAAVRVCYAAVRREYEPATETPAALTHWEFYRRHEGEAGPADETTDRLRAVIAEYERAAFAPDAVSRSTAKRVLERTRQLCDDAARSAGDAPSSAD